MKRLFPPYLQAPTDGKVCRGAAVQVWQSILLGMGTPIFGDHIKDLVCDGVNGEITTWLTGELQRQLGLETDGHLGPQTRSVLRSQLIIDLDAFPMVNDGQVTEWIDPESGELKIWNGSED